MTEPNVSAGEILSSYANHFVHNDWVYTRNHNILDIKINHHTQKLSFRIKSAFAWLFGDAGNMFHLGLKERFGMFFYVLKRDKNLPDGTLHSDSIITLWEEDGEYLQLVQPSVGNLLAEFLIAEPENPYAKKISAEINRIFEAYGQRIDSEVSNA